MRATVGYLTNIQPVPGTDHLEYMTFVSPQYKTQIVTGKHYGEGELGFHVTEGEVVPDELADEMELLGRLGGAKKDKVKDRVFHGVESNGIFYGSTGRHWVQEWESGDVLNFSVDARGNLQVVWWLSSREHEVMCYVNYGPTPTLATAILTAVNDTPESANHS